MPTNGYLLTCVVYTVLGYLSGGVLYAYWVPRWLKRLDVRDYGEDQNPGAANAAAACGLWIGILCAVLDIAKGCVPVLLAIHLRHVTGWYLVPVALAPVIGHGWPLLHRGQGGKCIAVSFGVYIALMPFVWLALIWAGLLLLCLPVVHDHRVLILITSLLTALISLVLYPGPLCAISCGVTGVLQIKHRKPRAARQIA